MLITREKEKLADAIIFFVKKTKYCGLTKLFKLLYFLDFIHFQETGRSVTDLKYETWKYGPAPKKLWKEIQKGLSEILAKAVQFQYIDTDEINRLTKITPLRKFEGKHLTRREKRIMETLAEIYLEATADQMIEITHIKGRPWDKTKKEKGLNAEIDYMLALDGANENQLDADEIKFRIKEMNEARKALR